MSDTEKLTCASGWDWHKKIEVYKDEQYTLGQEDGRAYLVTNKSKYILSCHPYEPCLYITDENGALTVVRNAFDPFAVLERFYNGDTVDSITGFRYTARDFCRMVEYAAGRGEINIDDAQKVFGDAKKGEDQAKSKENACVNDGVFLCPQGVSVIENDPFYKTAEEYPDNVIDYCLVKNDSAYKGINSHWEALLAGALSILEEDWTLHFDKGKIGAKSMAAKDLFDLTTRDGGGLTYKTAFLYPPYPHGYTEKDFDRVNLALFPNGTDALEIYEWTTDWSDYFDDGREWWGTLCLTVYDETLDRFAVIMASATD